VNGKLPVAIIWHMHQPYYKHPQTSEFVLPWVRLHASKDYLHMARLLQEFPGVKVHFTMVPSLRDQLEDYAQGADDEDTRVTMRTVESQLDADEKQHMLRRFFSIHHGNVISQYDEYRRLLQMAMVAGDRPELFSDDYFVDLALWFNLAWMDPDDIGSDDKLAALRERGRNFAREEVRYVIGRQRFMASGAPHLYHRLERQGQVEIMTVPYYHPILPLIPPSEMRRQVELNTKANRRYFGEAYRPQGFFPPEMCYSFGVARVAADLGFRWLIVDEIAFDGALG